MLRAAARANAEWCDAFCRAHGIPGRFDDDAWSSPTRTPPLYPDAVTLAPGVDAGALLARTDAGAGCSVKDSFADLDLAAAGFRPLFRASWIARAPLPRPPAAGWHQVTTPDGLAAWETAWGESPEPGFFRPALLAEPAVAVLARDDLRAGGVANRSGGVVGLSNVFAVDGDLAAAYEGAATAASQGLPVVGYERGAALAAARAAGFEPLGGLVVWVRS